MKIAAYLIFVTTSTALGGLLGYTQGIKDTLDCKRRVLRAWLVDERKH